MPSEPTTDELVRTVCDRTGKPGAVSYAIDVLCAAVRRVIVATVYLAQLIAHRGVPRAEMPVAPRGRPEEPLMDARQLANVLGWSEATVYRKAKAGEIPSVKLGKRSTRFRFSEVEKVLRE